MDISSWVTAIATTLLALITWFYVGLTKKILDAQTDPCIIVSTVHDANRPTIIQLVIKNIGSGLARDITFQCSQPLPQFAWGLTITDAKDAEVMSAGPLIDGISGLAPGEERRIDWGQYGGLMKALSSEPVLITTSFKKNTKVMPPVVSAVDVKSYKDTTAARSLSAKVASDIENISKNIEHLTSGFRSLRIELDDKNKFDQRDEPLGNNNK
jgi:hypothetical protein